jgi:hypothetical protein
METPFNTTLEEMRAALDSLSLEVHAWRSAFSDRLEKKTIAHDPFLCKHSGCYCLIMKAAEETNANPLCKHLFYVGALNLGTYRAKHS